MMQPSPLRLGARASGRFFGSDRYLAPRSANHAPITPLGFFQRTAAVFPSRTAIVYDDWRVRNDPARAPAVRQTWAETSTRVTRLASALTANGVARGDTVAVLSPNTPAFVELHHGVNAAGGVLNPLNTRLDAGTLAYILGHSEAKVLFADTALGPVAKAAVELLAAGGSAAPLFVDLVDPVDSHHPPGLTAATAPRFGSLDYEDLMSGGDEAFAWVMPHDEWDAQALNYTSGTTGRPKGVLYSHRGAALNGMNEALVWGMPQHPSYLWTLPMFHCNGWCFPYTTTLMGGTHVCLRSVEPRAIFGAIRAASVSHLCGAPVVMNMMVRRSASSRSAPPPSFPSEQLCEKHIGRSELVLTGHTCAHTCAHAR